MGPISVVVQDANNLTLEVTPTPSTTVIVDRGIAGPMGDGDVDGPASSTDNALVRFDGTTGKLIQNSVAILSDAGALIGLISIDTTNLEVTNVKAFDGTASFAIANTTGIMSIDDTKFTLQDNADTTKKALFELSGITTATTRTYTLPNATGTLATLANTSQTFTGSTSFVPATNSGTITIGGIPQTGTITVDRSQATHTLDIGVGPTLSGSTKTINFGTAGVSGSITAMSIGSTFGTTVTANGAWNFTIGAIIQGLSVGRGAGSIASNTALGANALAANTTGSNNTAAGSGALALNVGGSSNTAFGNTSQGSNLSGSGNTTLGDGTLYVNQTGGFNTAIGNSALSQSLGSQNIALGQNSGSGITTGSNNVILGSYTGAAAPISATGSNWIVLSDGSGNVRQSFDSSGNIQCANAVVAYAPAPASFSALATLTNANLQTQLIVTTGTTFTLTMPLGSDLDSLISWATVDLGYDFSVINTASGTITMAANTGITIVGRVTVLTAVSARFRIRRTAASTYIMYRIG